MQPEAERDGHGPAPHAAVLGHDDLRMRGDEAREPPARPHRVGAGVGGVVEPGLRVLHDVHRGDVGILLDVGVKRHRQPGEIRPFTDQFHFLDRPGLHRHQPPRRQPQPPGKGGQVFLRRDPEGARLQPAVLDQDVAHAETGVFHDVLEQDRPLALGREGAHVVDAHRLADDRHRVAVGVEEPAQVSGAVRAGRGIGAGEGISAGRGNGGIPVLRLVHGLLRCIGFMVRREQGGRPADPPPGVGHPGPAESGFYREDGETSDSIRAIRLAAAARRRRRSSDAIGSPRRMATSR